MTLTFWLIAAAMTIVVLGVLLYPLLKKRVGSGVEREKTLPVYRQQFSELEQDRSSGLLTDDQYRMARQELERAAAACADAGLPIRLPRLRASRRRRAGRRVAPVLA